MKKRFWSLLLAFCMTLSLLPTVFSAYGSYELYLIQGPIIVKPGTAEGTFDIYQNGELQTTLNDSEQLTVDGMYFTPEEIQAEYVTIEDGVRGFDIFLNAFHFEDAPSSLLTVGDNCDIHVELYGNTMQTTAGSPIEIGSGSTVDLLINWESEFFAKTEGLKAISAAADSSVTVRLKMRENYYGFINAGESADAPGIEGSPFLTDEEFIDISAAVKDCRYISVRTEENPNYVEIANPKDSYRALKLYSGNYLTADNVVTKEKPEDNYLYFEDGVLTMHNATVTGGNGTFNSDMDVISAVCSISSGKNLTLKIEGTNVINAKDFGKEEFDDTYGIYCSETLTITADSNSDSLTVNGGSTGTGTNLPGSIGYSYGNSFAVFAKRVVLSGGTVTATGGDADGISAGIVAKDDSEGALVISDGNITATGGPSGCSAKDNAPTFFGESYGFAMFDGFMCDENGAITVKGGQGTAQGGVCQTVAGKSQPFSKQPIMKNILSTGKYNTGEFRWEPVPFTVSFEGNDLGYHTFGEAWTAAKEKASAEDNRAVLTMNQNHTCGKDAVFGIGQDEHITLDLNGKTLQAEEGRTERLFTVADRASFTLRDSSSDESGKISGRQSFGIRTDGGAVLVSAGGKFTLESGEITCFEAENGGAVMNEGTFLMTGGMLTGNEAWKGGGVYNTGAFEMTSGAISGNESVHGGGVCTEGNAATAVIRGGDICNNDVTRISSGGSGGGVSALNTDLEITGGDIYGNHSIYGGGVYLDGNGKTLTVSGGNIYGNSADGHGGGICVMTVEIYNPPLAALVLTGGEISRNSTDFQGGGIALWSADFRMTGGSISQNASSLGGGVYIGGEANCKTELHGGSVTQNTANSLSPETGGSLADGGGVYYSAGALSFKNDIVISENLADEAANNFKMYDWQTVEIGQMKDTAKVGISVNSYPESGAYDEISFTDGLTKNDLKKFRSDIPGYCLQLRDSKAVLALHIADRTVVDNEYLKTPADCTNNAVYYKSCFCGIQGEETFEAEKSALKHDFDRAGNCTRCGEAATLRIRIGDLDGDNQITAKDAVLLKRTLAHWNVTAQIKDKNPDLLKYSADVDQSGELNAKDSTLISRWLAGWTVPSQINTMVYPQD